MGRFDSGRWFCLIVGVLALALFEFFNDPVRSEEIEKEQERLDNAAAEEWQNVIDLIFTGEISGAYYDTGKGENFNRYVITLSTRESGKLQRSVFWMKNGAYIPSSHNTTKDAYKLMSEAPERVELTLF